MKPLFITIDTEGDSLWDYSEIIRTENVKSIPRFQNLCEKYGFIPIWLTDYEIINDARFVEFIKPKVQEGKCEVGIHIHSQYNPPYYNLERMTREGEYLIEYPFEIILGKINCLKSLIENRIECPVYSHRAGRWAINDKYVTCLIQAGILYDCSVTPGINWFNFPGATKDSHGADYSKYSREVTILFDSDNKKYLTEFPVSIMEHERFFTPDFKRPISFAKELYHFAKKQKIWLRPTGNNLSQMKYILNKIYNDPNEEYAEFMIHSSELHLGTSHLFSTADELEHLYNDIEVVFKYANDLGFYGSTFRKYDLIRR